MIDFQKTIISQFANSPTIVGLVTNMNAYIDQTANFQSFYDFVWNVNTAQGFGLDIWGRILGVSRNLQIAAPLAGNFFGFNIAPTAANTPIGTGNGVTVTFTLVGVNGTPVTPLAGVSRIA